MPPGQCIDGTAALPTGMSANMLRFLERLKPHASNAQPGQSNAEVVRHMYRTLLAREPEPEALANATAWLDSGASLDALHETIVTSDEYTGQHPLAHLDSVYRPRNISYFTYRGHYRPLGLSIETVNICNNDCIICPYSSQTRRRQTMPMSLFEKIVSDYEAVGGGPITLTPMVGEVFLDKLLPERLKRLKNSPTISRVSTITNATMVSRYTDEELADIVSYFDRLTVSIYGLDAEEFRIMTRKDRYQAFREGLVKLLRVAGAKKVGLGARHLKKRSDAEIDAWLQSIAEDAGVQRSDIRFGGTMQYANWSFFDTSTQLPFDAEWTPQPENREQCALPLISMQVLSNGSVSFCGCADFDGKTELTIGNINDRSLGDMLKDERIRRLWNWQKCGIPEFCKSCSFHMPISALKDLPGTFADPYGTFGG
ncbi:MAG: radical SAM protein [Rhizobiaceae bacterium]|nr:radical SAM protein [Rhizobiaceae bacterium]